MQNEFDLHCERTAYGLHSNHTIGILTIRNSHLETLLIFRVCFFRKFNIEPN